MSHLRRVHLVFVPGVFKSMQPKIIILEHIPPRLHTSRRFNTVEIRRGMDAKVFKHLQENARKQMKWDSMAWRSVADNLTQSRA